jgi:uncharacterized membrane protein YjfL (UPF0719 family)
METMRTIAVVLAGSGVVVGVFSLLAAWFAPRTLATPFMRWLTTGRSLEPSRDNQTLMAVWSILLGTFLVLAVSGQSTLGLAVFMLWLPVGIVVIRRRFWPSSRA